MNNGGRHKKIYRPAESNSLPRPFSTRSSHMFISCLDFPQNCRHEKNLGTRLLTGYLSSLYPIVFHSFRIFALHLLTLNGNCGVATHHLRQSDVKKHPCYNGKYPSRQIKTGAQCRSYEDARVGKDVTER